MEFKISQNRTGGNLLFITDEAEKISGIGEISDQEKNFALQAIEKEENYISINQYSRHISIFYLKEKKTASQTLESVRKAGAHFAGICNQNKIEEITIINLSASEKAAYTLAEGMSLAGYQFLKYRSETKKIAYTLKTISFSENSISEKELLQLSATTQAIYKARNLVNEPLNYLSAEKLSEEINHLGRESGFKVRVLHKEEIEKEKMGGILAVNRGSIDPPTFTVMEYKPGNALNENPIVLVGKGIVYDTGGLSLKPTPSSMDRMKSDMSGAALVSGAMYAIATMRLPLNIIALVPATDNRPGENAYVPGDIITMYSGATVEVLNTDAEGRLVLADALQWAKRYDPELVIDFATLTGAASVAVGEHGIVCMGTADENVKKAFKESGMRQYERLVEYPLWDEYGEMIKSEFADLKNIGGPAGGAITAGKFLEYFTGYPWMHFDIAGVSFSTSKKGYIPAGGTATGLRMLLDFLMHYGSEEKA